MPHVRGHKALVILLVAFVVGCSRVENYKQAQVQKDEAGFTVELRGTRQLMAHDPVSALRGKTYVETFRLRLPRLEGIIDANDIPVNAGSYKYLGRIVITGSSMKVDLYYDNVDDRRKDPLSWNGEYVLVTDATER